MLLLLLGCAGGDDDRLTYGETELSAAVRVESLPGVYLEGEEAERAGAEVAFADVTGDGRADAVVGPTRRAAGGGESPAVVVVAAPFVGDAPLTAADATVGVVGASSLTLRGVADLDRDGAPELLASVGWDGQDARRDTGLLVAWGALSGARWWDGPTDGLSLLALEEREGWLARCPVVAGDVSRDGEVDLVTCGRFYTAGKGSASRGAVVLLPGPTPEGEAVAEPATLFAAPEEDAGFGAVLALAELGGGGLRSVVVGAAGTVGDLASPPALYVYDAPPAGVVEAADADRVLLVDPEAGALGGALVAGDVDADGYEDLVVVADPTGESPAGVWLVPGPVGVDHVRDGVRVWEGALAADEYPPALALPGDLDGDGAAEIAVGTADEAVDAPGSGVVRVVFGPHPGTRVTTVFGAADERTREDGVAVHQQRLGAALAGADADADGLPELLIGAPGWSNDYSGLMPGAYVISGGAW